ncbi:MAG: hypothetical protein ED557_11065 [Balneola sp.]|nr:MAG: hypothetical protein ED557_11065 [Balneola sp.]
MQEEEFIVALVAIVFGIGLTGFFLHNVFGLIKAWINRKSSTSSGEINPQFFKALGEFKKTTERRISNLEAIVSDLEEEKIRIPDSSESIGEITIEEKGVRAAQKKEDDSNLRNMLNE